MPHIVIETSKNVAEAVNRTALVEDAHNALAKELGEAIRIKTRLMVAEEVVVGDEGTSGAMMHVTLLLLEGRDVPTKQQYSGAILEAVKPHLADIAGCKLTLEVRDMDKDTYIL